jgi:hypothetical protein
MSAEQVPHNPDTSSRFSWPRRRGASLPPAPIVTHLAGTAVDPRLVAAPLDGLAAIEDGVLKFSARLTAPADDLPVSGATILFTISLAARTTVKCAAVTDEDGVARTESTLPAGLFDGGPVEFRVGFAGAPPHYWPASVAGEIV